MILILMLSCSHNSESFTDSASCSEGYSYSNFGDGFIQTYCQGCHSSTSEDRQGAPTHITFDTEEEVMSWTTEIQLQSLGNSPSMPPLGGVSIEELQALEEWLQCSYP